MSDDAGHNAGAATEAPTRTTFLFEIWSAPMDSSLRFDDQVKAIKQIASWDPGSRSWYCHVDAADAERLAEVATQLYAVARQYGTAVRLTAPEGTGARG